VLYGDGVDCLSLKVACSDLCKRRANFMREAREAAADSRLPALDGKPLPPL
jgi:hypothetical protein